MHFVTNTELSLIQF